MTWLLTAVTNLAAFFGLAMAKKTALAAAAVAASIVLTLAFAAVIQNAVVALVVSVPSEFAIAAYFLPSNLSACLSAVIAAKVARFVYDWNMRNLQIAASIN